MYTDPSKPEALCHPSPLAATPGAFAFPFPGFVENVIKEAAPEILFMKRDIQFRGLRQYMELDASGGSAHHVSIVPHNYELLIVTATFYSPGRDDAELPTPKPGGLLSRIAAAAPVPSTIDHCEVQTKESLRDWKLLDGSMWCYFPVHVQTSQGGPYRTEARMKDGWLPHGKLIMKFDVEPDPKNPVRYQLLKAIGFFPDTRQSWQSQLHHPR